MLRPQRRGRRLRRAIPIKKQNLRKLRKFSSTFDGRVATTDGSRGLQSTVSPKTRHPSRSDGGIRPQAYRSREHTTRDSGVANATHFPAIPEPWTEVHGYRPVSLRDTLVPLRHLAAAPPPHDIRGFSFADSGLA